MKHAFAGVIFAGVVLATSSAFALTSVSVETEIEKIAIKLANEAVEGGYELITMEEVKTMIDSGEDFVLIDAHPRWEFEMAHIEGAEHFGFQSRHVGDWDTDVDMDGSPSRDDYRAVLGPDLDKKIVIYCGFTKCGRSNNASVWAKELGYTNIYRAPGGITAWKDLGYSYKVVPNENHVYPNR